MWVRGAMGKGGERLEAVRGVEEVERVHGKYRGRVFGALEVAAHHTPDDCWVVVNGGVYDVTSFVPRHPGGAMIYVKAGGDCTQLFESYHPLSAAAVLRKYRIGSVDLASYSDPAYVSTSQPRVLYNTAEAPANGELSHTTSSEFYGALKARQEAYFKRKGLKPRVSAAMYSKSAVILVSLVVAYLGTYFTWKEGADSLLAPFLCALAMGLAKMSVGVSIQHDANHGAYSENTWLSWVMGTTLDWVGASSFMWKQQHVVGHHAYTNVEGQDPDIRVNDPDVRCVSQEQPRRPYHAWQHVYLPFMYGLLSFKSILADDFQSYFAGRIGPVHVAKMTAAEAAVFWGGKLFYALVYVALPLRAVSLPRFLILWACSEAVTGYGLAFMFQVAHVVEDAFLHDVKWDRTSGVVAAGKGLTLNENAKRHCPADDWAGIQVATSANFSLQDSFWTFMSGGLNYQVEHHLFPGVCHCWYPHLEASVRETCAEFGLPYYAYDTFPQALFSHFEYLRKVGGGKALGLPRLGDA